MELVITIITSLTALVGVGLKAWFQARDLRKLQADLAQARRETVIAIKAVDRERAASKERGAYVIKLERSIRDHLKACNTPLAAWAQQLFNNPDPSKP